MNKDLVNKRNTREWVKCNEDSKAHIWRDSFVEEHGGQFIQEGRNWKWEEQKIIADNRIKQERKDFIFINSDGLKFRNKIVEEYSPLIPHLYQRGNFSSRGVSFQDFFQEGFIEISNVLNDYDICIQTR